MSVEVETPKVEQMELEPTETPPPEIKSFQDRLSEIPAYTMTLSQLQQLYSTLKEKNDVLKNAFTTGEQYVEKITQAAKPVVIQATETALKVAKPVVGEIEDPGKNEFFIIASYIATYRSYFQKHVFFNKCCRIFHTKLIQTGIELFIISISCKNDAC